MNDTDPDRERALAKRRADMREKSYETATSIAKLAGLEVKAAWELANGYWPDSPHYDDSREPWWLLQTDIGLVRIGRRKRVLEICWSACAFRGIVTNDDVTKEMHLVHAYSVEKAVEYMRELARRAKADLAPSDS